MDLTAIIIVAIVFGSVITIIKTIFNYAAEKSKYKDLDSHASAEIESLKERVATLEKIVTDEKYSLKREFERL